MRQTDNEQYLYNKESILLSQQIQQSPLLTHSNLALSSDESQSCIPGINLTNSSQLFMDKEIYFPKTNSEPNEE